MQAMQLKSGRCIKRLKLDGEEENPQLSDHAAGFFQEGG